MTTPTVLTTPPFKAGIYQDVPELDYHARRFGPPESISSTEAKRVLQAPALHHYRRTHPEEPRTAFDVGHAAHALILGNGVVPQQAAHALRLLSTVSRAGEVAA